MRILKLRYLPILALLIIGFLAGLRDGGYRLPRYYTPDGMIVPVNPSPGMAGLMGHIEMIGGVEPVSAPAIFDSGEPLVVTMNDSTGLMRKIPNDAYIVLYTFKYSLLLAVLYLLLTFWFVEYGRDFHLASLSFVLAGIHYFTYTVLAYHDFQLIWLIFIFALIPAILNMSLRTTGKEITGSIMLLELLMILFLSFLAYVGHDRSEAYSKLIGLVKWLVGGSVVLLLFIQIDNALKSSLDTIEKLKRWSLVGGSFLGMLLPGVLLLSGFPLSPSSDRLIYSFILSLFFPASLLYGTYRIHIVPFQFLATRSLVGTILTIIAVAVYGMVLITHNLIIPIPEKQNRWMVSITFLLILVFFLDPVRKWVSRLIDKRIFRLEPELTLSLDRLATLSASPVSFSAAARQFSEELQNTLHVENVTLLFSEESFPEATLKHAHVIRIPRSSTYWRHIPPDRITVTSYLTFGSGSRGDLYRFLMRNRIYLAVGVTGAPGRINMVRDFLERFRSRLEHGTAGNTGQEIRSALLIGHRKDKSKFTLTETRYLQEAARMGALIIDNYVLLLQDLEKRRNERQLFLAGRLQQKMTDNFKKGTAGIRVSLLVNPVASVTGDYVDVLELDGNRTAVFLGDVSGHGLGTGYLVSAIRSIVRSRMENGSSLEETVMTVHSFLAERYNGKEFFTLFASIVEATSGILTYINAGHPGPFLQVPPTGETRRIPATMSLLGVLDTKVELKTINLRPGQRLYIYSDGIIETFDEKERAFGFKGLEKIIQESNSVDLEKIPPILSTALHHHRGNAPITDDISFIVLEYQPDEQGSIQTFYGLPGPGA